MAAAPRGSDDPSEPAEPADPPESTEPVQPVQPPEPAAPQPAPTAEEGSVPGSSSPARSAAEVDDSGSAQGAATHDAPGSPLADSSRREPTSAEVDTAFAQIASRLGPTGLTPAALTPGPDNQSDQGGPRDYNLTEEPEEGYLPPEPEPINVTDPFLVSAWVATVGGPVGMLVLLILWPGAPASVWIGLLVAALLGGVALAWRLPRHPRDDDDDGAVV